MRTEPPRRMSWPLLTGLAVVTVFLALLVHGGAWRCVGVLHLEPVFADLAAVLAAGEAHQAGIDIYRENPFDPFGRTHVYGPWWLVSGALGLKTADALWLGAALGLAFLAVALRVLRPRTRGESALAFLLLLSPGVLLGLERANNDLVVFLLAALAAWCAARPARAAGLGAVALVVVNAALKFYPLIALGAVLGRRESRGWRVALVALGAVVFAGLWLAQAEHYWNALTVAPRPVSIFAYGIGVMPLAWRLLPEARGLLLAGFLPALALGAWLGWAQRRRWWELLPPDGARSMLAVMAGAAWLLCYGATLNFPYRAVLLIPLFPFWWSAAAGRPGRAVAGGVLAALWLGVPKLLCAPAAAAGESGWKDAITFISGLEQALLLGMNAVLVLSLAGWAWRAWHRAPAPDR